MQEIIHHASNQVVFSLFLLSRATNSIMQTLIISYIFRLWNAGKLDSEHLCEMAGSRTQQLVNMILTKKAKMITYPDTIPYNSDLYTSSLLSTVCYYDVCMSVDDFCQGIGNQADIEEFLLFLTHCGCVSEIVNILVGFICRPYCGVDVTFDSYYSPFISSKLNQFILANHQSTYDQVGIQHLLMCMKDHISHDVLEIVHANVGCIIADYDQRYVTLDVMQQRKVDIIMRNFQHTSDLVC